MESITQKFSSDPFKMEGPSKDDPSKTQNPDNPSTKEEDLPAPERAPRIPQPPEVEDPKAVPPKEFDPNYTEQPEIDLPQHETHQKGYDETPREDLVPEFNNNAKDRGNSAESSGDPASAFAEK